MSQIPGFDYDDLMNLVSGDDFEERPVDVETFIYGYDYLDITQHGQNPLSLSEIQMEIVKAASQIYRKDTLISLYGIERGMDMYRKRYNEIIMQLGKGSGKDFTSTVAVAYIVYLLLCLRDPAAYYEKPAGNTIDIINIAINAQQANVVFFKNFQTLIEKAPWFEGRYDPKGSQINFDKNVTVYSGHSEREAFEGYNTLIVILDEISGFATDSASGNPNAKTAQSIYDMYRASVTSRFPDDGKLLLLSFPRYKDDFIQSRYDEVIAEKEVLIREVTVKLDPDLPDGIESNEFVIEWEEDHIQSYAEPHVLALKRPSWSVNPTKKPQNYARDFFKNYVDALSRFACMPPDSVDGFFKDRQKIEQAFHIRNGVDETGAFRDWFQPIPGKTYFVHVDLAKKHDNCAVAMAHVDKFKQIRQGGGTPEIVPEVIVDAVRWWKPTPDQNVDFVKVREYIVSLRQRGFDVRLVTFDRWQSEDMIDYLESIGMRAERLSVAIAHYTDLSICVQEERVHGPDIELLRKELRQLQIMPNGKLDHPRKGSKDLADATAGAVYNAIAHTPRDQFGELEVLTMSEMRAKAEEDRIQQQQIRNPNVISQPKKDIPPELASWLDGMRLL